MAKEQKNPQRKPEDNMIYKVMLDLAILAAGFALLQVIGRNYGYADSYDVWNTIFLYVSVLAAVIAAAGIVFAFAGKNRKPGIIMAVAGAAAAAASFSLYRLWYAPIPFLYFFLVAGCALYLIRLLYPRDFFLIALLTTAFGGTFYLHGKHGTMSSAVIICYLLSAILLASTALTAHNAAKHGGKLTLNGRIFRIFSPKATAMPMYFACIICGACALAANLVGAAFAHYCVYAAVAGLFIAACYYTIRLD